MVMLQILRWLLENEIAYLFVSQLCPIFFFKSEILIMV